MKFSRGRAATVGPVGGRKLNRKFSFDEQLKLSDGVSESRDIERLLLEEIPGAVNAHRAHTSNDKNGTDWWVEHRSGKHLSIDCKIRTEDFLKSRGKDDLALETWSVLNRKVGWTRDENKRGDYILWLWTDTGRWCLVSFPMLCRVFQKKWEEWSRQYMLRQQETEDPAGNWKSECVFVPRHEVWAEIYRAFSGNQKVNLTRPPSANREPAGLYDDIPYASSD